MKKFIIWTLGIIGGLVLLSLAFGILMFFIGSSYVEEAKEFAASHTKHECLLEMAARTSECSGATCLMGPIGFGNACLEVAEGDRSVFCNGRQAAQTLPVNYCAPYQESEYCSQAIAGALSEYCKASAKQ